MTVKLSNGIHMIMSQLAPAEAEKEENAKLIEQLKKEKAEFNRKLALSAKAGFDWCLGQAVILEPTQNTDLLDAKYKAVDGKIVYQGRVIYDPTTVNTPAAEDKGNPVDIEGEN